MNFGLAKEQYAALHPKQTDLVKFVIVGEDVAVGKTQGSIVGRRCVLIYFRMIYVYSKIRYLEGLQVTDTLDNSSVIR